jgi:hypothetical protein
MTTHHPAAEAPVERIVDAIAEAVEARTGAAFYVPGGFKEMLLDQFDAAILEATDEYLKVFYEQRDGQDARIAELEKELASTKEAERGALVERDNLGTLLVNHGQEVRNLRTRCDEYAAQVAELEKQLAALTSDAGRDSCAETIEKQGKRIAAMEAEFALMFAAQSQDRIMFMACNLAPAGVEHITNPSVMADVLDAQSAMLEDYTEDDRHD